MSDFTEIKNRIYEEERIEEVLELLGCWGIDSEQGGKLIIAALPDGENKRSVQVKNNPSLASSIRSRGINGSIFDIVSYILYEAESEDALKMNLPKSKFWICTKLKYNEYIDAFYKETSDQPKQIQKYNGWLKKIKNNVTNQVPKNVIRDASIVNEFGNVPYFEWINEGITGQTQRLFGVGIDVHSDRITFPVHDKSGNIVGVKGRYCGRSKDVEDKYKYLYVVPCNKSIEFFNLHRATPYIDSSQEVIVVEGAKTVMLLHQWGYKNVISIEGDSLSSHQITLLKELGLSTKYIFAWDKDKSIEFVKKEIQRLNGRNRYAIYDKDELLSSKNSPTDQGKKVWENLYQNYQYKIT